MPSFQSGKDLAWQWERNNTSLVMSDVIRRDRLAMARSLIRETRLRRSYIDMLRLRMFMLATRWTRADRGYLLHVPSVIARYWMHADGAAPDGGARELDLSKEP